MEIQVKSVNMKYELKRKMIHISSLIFPLLFNLIEREAFLILLGTLSLLMILLDIFRKKHMKIGLIYDKFLGDILRSHESDKKNILFTGGTYIVISFFLCAVLFQKEIATLAMLIIIISDTAAAITGMTIGRIKIGTKTLEGSLAFFFSGIVLFFLVIKPSGLNIIYYGLIALLLTTIFELIPMKTDDNITIPLFFGIVYSTLTNTDLLI